MYMIYFKKLAHVMGVLASLKSVEKTSRLKTQAGFVSYKTVWDSLEVREMEFCAQVSHSAVS